ncbi:MAG: hypothetical protein HOW73_06255 [Polyangiaceae bacterium]|nr:hypothetical protein [Polyangiaceae bacterium]
MAPTIATTALLFAGIAAPASSALADGAKERDPRVWSVAEESALSRYGTFGVGQYARGVVHGEAGVARVDVGLGETCVAFALGRAVMAQAGYQYGGHAFVGIGQWRWSAKLGLNPETGATSAGIGYGAPLLPMPSLITSAARRSYVELVRTDMAAQLLDGAIAAATPVTDVLGAGRALPFGVGAQAGFAPEDFGAYAFVGVQGSL